MDGGRRRLRRGGYVTCEVAAAARDRLSVPLLGDPRDGVYTVVEWLETRVETRARLRDSTRRMYRSHIRLYFRKLLDVVLLRELDIGHVQEAFQRLFDEGMTAATARRLFSTLRSALSAAVRERLIPDNPARYLKLPKGRRPFAVVWTRRRVEQWRRTGERPVVAVWTPAQLAQFLSSIAGHPLFAAYHLIAMRGLRDGWTCGIPVVHLGCTRLSSAGRVAVRAVSVCWPPHLPVPGLDGCASRHGSTSVSELAGHLLDTDSSCQATRRQESPKSAMTFSSPPRARM
jgi:hypothetical protein